MPVTVEAVSLWSLKNALNSSQDFASERELKISQQQGAANKTLQQAGLHLSITSEAIQQVPQTQTSSKTSVLRTPSPQPSGLTHVLPLCRVLLPYPLPRAFIPACSHSHPPASLPSRLE